MITFSDITVWIRDVYASRFEPEGVRPLADMLWRALVITAAILVVMTLLFGLWNFFGVVDTLSSLADTSPPPPAAFSSAALHRVSAGLEARQTLFDSFKSNPPPAIPDPSK